MVCFRPKAARSFFAFSALLAGRGALGVFALLIWFLQAHFALAQQPQKPKQKPQTPQAQQELTYVPGVWRGSVKYPKPDLQHLDKLRFITENDYPPFNYLDEEGTLTGFNVDLATTICDVLAVECDIKSKNWNELLPEISRNVADAAIASIRITARTSRQVDFTDVYYTTPARFVARNNTKLATISPRTLKGVTIGVKENSAHQAYLKAYFPQAKIVPFFNHKGVRNALKTGKVNLIFGDGISLVFWLNGAGSAGCCSFVGGPYLEPKYFGHGVAIAVRKGNRQLREILNYAMNQIRLDGRFEELFLRYFPINFN